MLKFISNFETKALEDGSITIKGIASSNTMDRDGDVILPTAWKDGLASYQKNPILLAYHRHDQPIGKVLETTITDKGLEVTAVVSKSAGAVYDLIKEGILSTFSVGFRVKEANYDDVSDIFVIKQAELLELSVVSIPANPDASFSVAKSFDNESELKNFKDTFIHKEPKMEITQKDSTVVELEKKVENMTAAVELLLEKQTEAEKEKAAKMEAEKVSIQVQDRVEALQSDLEKAFADKEKSFAETIDKLRAEIQEKGGELMKLRENKMKFSDKSENVAEKDICSAMLLAKAMGRPVTETRYGKGIVEKAAAHLAGMSTPADWEQTFSTKLWNDIQLDLKVKQLFANIAMTSPVMQIPVNPEAGLGSWVTTANYRGANSTGTAVDHTPSDAPLTAHKLVAKEYLGYEEEEDSILPLLPMINAAIVRRVSRSLDRALLIGAGSGSDPVTGMATFAVAAATNLAIPVATVVDSDDFQTLRQSMGRYGLNPKDVVYIVSTEVYFDLLKDINFKTMDNVGDMATLLTGQVGMMHGSPVIVSGEFEAKAATKHAAVAVNKNYFITGTLRNLVIERDRDIEEQKNILVASTRMGFVNVTGASTTPAACITWAV